MGGIAAGDMPVLLMTIATLVFLEGLLSADNALVLAVMVRHLPKEQQKRALRYGIWGAFAFRLIAVLLSSLLLKFWHFKVVGGLYLLYLSISHFIFGEGRDADPAQPRSQPGKGFWATVVAVELADIAFSIDSILAAVTMADTLPDHIGYTVKLAVIYIGGILGIITMRYVAGWFIVLLERFDGLNTGAYALVAWIGLKLLLDGLYSAQWIASDMPPLAFWGGMGVIVLASLAYRRKQKPGPDAAGAAEHETDPANDHVPKIKAPTDDVARE